MRKLESWKSDSQCHKSSRTEIYITTTCQLYIQDYTRSKMIHDMQRKKFHVILLFLKVLFITCQAQWKFNITQYGGFPVIRLQKNFRICIILRKLVGRLAFITKCLACRKYSLNNAVNDGHLPLFFSCQLLRLNDRVVLPVRHRFSGKTAMCLLPRASQSKKAQDWSQKSLLNAFALPVSDQFSQISLHQRFCLLYKSLDRDLVG